MEARRPERSRSLLDRLRCFIDTKAAADAARITELEAECKRLQTHLHEADDRGKVRSEALYDLQRQYSTEHFELQESMRNLKIERMRNAGMFADRDIVLARAKQLQERIQCLKERLRKYEPVDDALLDEGPIVREDPVADQGAGPDS